MSTTGNEYEQPGVNYPDREDAAGTAPGADDAQRDEDVEAPPTMGEPGPDARTESVVGAPPEGSGGGAEPSHEAVGVGVIDDGASHHGQDAGRDTVTASEAQNADGGLGGEQEQRLPAMSQNNASDLEKVTGIVAQTRADVATEPFERIVEVLDQRLTQAGVQLPRHDVEELARQVSTGDAESPGQA